MRGGQAGDGGPSVCGRVVDVSGGDRFAVASGATGPADQTSEKVYLAIQLARARAIPGCPHRAFDRPLIRRRIVDIEWPPPEELTVVSIANAAEDVDLSPYTDGAMVSAIAGHGGFL